MVSAVIGILITGGAIFGAFYKVTSPTISRAVVRARPARARLRLDLGAACAPVRGQRADGP
jgi:hypothetical protein